MYWSSMYESSRYKFESKLGSVQCTGLVYMKVVGINLKVYMKLVGINLKVSWAVYNVLV